MGDRTPPLVLLIDDVDDNSDMYAQFLEFEGYQVATAINGAQGIDKARALSPMVIIMDLSMPVLDGWNATRELKSDDATRHIPIIVLTAHAMKGTAESVASVLESRDRRNAGAKAPACGLTLMRVDY